MKLFETYQDLISYYKNIQIEIEKSYYEKHHIKPRCMGGDNSQENLIKLPFEAHIQAHLLLYKECENLKDKKRNLLAAMIISGQRHISADELMLKLQDKEFCDMINFIRQNANKKNIGRVCIHKDEIVKKVFPDELEKFLEDGFEVGMPKSFILKINATKEIRGNLHKGNGGYKFTNEDKLEISKRTKEGMQKAKEKGISVGRPIGLAASNKGKIQITDGIHNKYIFENEAIPAGWNIGSTQRHPPKKWMTNGTDSLAVTFDKIDEYLSKGWHYGRVMKKRDAE